MQHNLRLSPIAMGLLLASVSQVHAAQALELQDTSLPAITKQFNMLLPGVKALGTVSGNALKYVSESTDHKQVKHVRMQQQYNGFNVVGGYAIVHSKNSAMSLLTANNNAEMSGKVYNGLEADLGQTPDNFLANSQNALQQFKTKFAKELLSEEAVTPLVYMDAQHKAHWAYKVSIFVTYKDKIPARPSAIVDATTFAPYVEWNDVKTIGKPVLAKGFGGNQKAGQFDYGNVLPLLEVTRNNATKKCSLENKDVKVIDMDHDYFGLVRAMRFNCSKPVEDGSNVYMTGKSGDGYDKINGAYSPSNDALYSGYVIKHMYFDWYGVEALVKANGTPMQLVMRVHYGDGYENAFWDGRQMTFGDGEDFFYPLVSLGVASHEISHGFTEQHSGLEYYDQSGGMNESFSDMAAQAAEHYSTGVSSWFIGAEIVKEDSGYEALRYMEKPSDDGYSIDSADEYTSSLDVHHSSGVYNHLFFLMAHQDGWDTRKAFDVMVKANMDYWTPYETFEGGGCGVLKATRDLNYPIDAVKSSLEKVAISFDNCKL